MRLFLTGMLSTALVITVGCSSTPSGEAGGVSTGMPPVRGAPVSGASLHKLLGSAVIQHIVVIVQENRTVDNLFNGFPNANTVPYGKNIFDQTVQLQPESLTAPYDLSHKHTAWLFDYNSGNMNGFSSEAEVCFAKHNSDCPKRAVAAYGYVPKNETEPYWNMAETYTFADNLFQTNQGPSFPAHQYIVSGTSTISNGSSLKASDNPKAPQDKGHQGGCNSLPGTTVPTIDANGNAGKSVYPCFERTSIMDLMNSQGVSWHYYQEFGGSGEWHAVDAIKQIWEGHSYENVIWPSAQVLKDIRNRELPEVTFVTPSAAESDHAGQNDGTGPSWVASIVNTIGGSSYWNHTAIIVTWDDWGGWYDHVGPKVYNSYELGFRVPMIVVSPYAKPGYVSHVPYEFGSILKFIEETFDLGSLGTTDVRANDLSDCFNFDRPARTFKPIAAPYSARYFEHLPISYKSPDDDN
jgi:phospholipase C